MVVFKLLLQQSKPAIEELAMLNIIKICAERLRTFSKNHGIKLKPTHAHELAAAFFGYKSKAALYADNRYQISNLPQAKVIVLIPSSPIDERRKNLEGFPTALPDSNTLCEDVFTFLANEKLIVATKIWSFHDIKRQAILLAHEYQDEKQLSKIYYPPSSEEVKMEISNEEIRLTITPYYPVVGYRPDGSGRNYLSGLLTTICLKRVAGHIGYAEPEISARSIPMLVKASL